jgi:hypothetical protein
VKLEFAVLYGGELEFRQMLLCETLLRETVEANGGVVHERDFGKTPDVSTIRQ